MQSGLANRTCGWQIPTMTASPCLNSRIAERLPEIARVCRELDVQRLAVFGSAVTPAFDVDRSDIDVLVEFSPGVDLGPWLSRLTKLKTALEAVLKRTVDVVTAASLRDPRFQIEVEKTLIPLYDARQVPQTVG